MRTEMPEGAVRLPRSDATRNREKILTAAREAFAETGVTTSLEAIARRAHVGIGTLYRHFPNRQALLEAVYVEEVHQLCAAVDEFAELPPWEGFAGLAKRLGSYLATKKALANELLSYLGREDPFFKTCRGDLFASSEPILERAQAAHVVRADTNFTEVMQLVGGIAKIDGLAPEQRDHMLEIALAGFRDQG